MKLIFVIFSTIALVYSAEVRLSDLEPSDAQQLIDRQDTSLKYAPKIDSNVPAVRFLGNEPHHVREDIYLANQYHGQDGLGGYLYGYAVPDIAKTERKKAGGDLTGAYNYISGDGQEIKVQYWDDGTGFHQVDNVPKILPKDNPEVAAAKAEFDRIWHEEAERNSRPVASPYDNEGKYLKGFGPQPQDVPQGGHYGPVPQVHLGNQQYQYNPQGQYSQSQTKSIPAPHAGQNVQYYRDAQYQGQQSANAFVITAPQPVPRFQIDYSTGTTQHHGQSQVPANPHQSSYQVQPQASSVNQVQSQVPQSQSQPSPQAQSQVPQASNIQSQSQSYHSQDSTSNQVQGQASAQVSTQFAPQPQARAIETGQYSSQQGDGEDDGGYDPKKYETEEPTGPPKGFFYNFDYPVGIIVKEEGVVKRQARSIPQTFYYVKY